VTPFQQACRGAAGAVLDAFGIDVGSQGWTSTAAIAPPGGADHLRTAFVFGRRTYELYLYPEEAGAKIDRSWYTLERGQYAGADELITVFRKFLRGCLEGTSPPDALRRARGAAGHGARSH